MTLAQELRPEHEHGLVRGRVALVTGGTRGIGAAICRRLAAEGASIAAGFRRQEEQAQKFLASMTADFPDARITLHEGNIGSADDCRRVVREVIQQHGSLDILVNNAGITIDRTVAKMTDEDWQKVIAVNLSGAFFIAQSALDHMLKRGTGRIISVSSVIGETGNIGQANYAASKSGLFGLTKSLAREAVFQLQRADRPVGDGVGLTVNAVTPGFTSQVKSGPSTAAWTCEEMSYEHPPRGPCPVRGTDRDRQVRWRSVERASVRSCRPGGP